MNKHGLTLILLLLLLQPFEKSLAITCAELDGAYVFSQEPSPTYLGFFGSSFASDSINNSFGSYGSTFSSLSVRNTFGSYGSAFRTYSANNSFSSSPPEIHKYGNLIGYLTTNTFIFGGVSLANIDSSCSFFAFSPSTLPSVPVGLTAANIANTNRIALTWNPSEGAFSYGVYIAASLTGQKSLIGTVPGSNAEVTITQTDVLFYFWVSAVNSFGESLLSMPASGSIEAPPDLDGDGILDEIDNCPNNQNANQLDTDSDGMGNVCDIDDDNDGMPDTYENDNGFNPLDNSDANGDADGDGYTNLTEFLRRSDPNDFNSIPKIILPWLPILLLE